MNLSRSQYWVITDVIAEMEKTILLAVVITLAYLLRFMKNYIQQRLTLIITPHDRRVNRVLEEEGQLARHIRNRQRRRSTRRRRAPQRYGYD